MYSARDSIPKRIEAQNIVSLSYRLDKSGSESSSQNLFEQHQCMHFGKECQLYAKYYLPMIFNLLQWQVLDALLISQVENPNTGNFVCFGVIGVIGVTRTPKFRCNRCFDVIVFESQVDGKRTIRKFQLSTSEAPYSGRM